MHSEFEAVIGLEVHVQLSTNSKIFCGCRARFTDGRSVADVAPNSSTCPVCTAQPGALPVLNRKVVDYTIRAGLALQCQINQRSVFARKNYFYPDLPKGYQISQYDLPICEHGFLEIVDGAGAPKKIRIVRIHMEEDAGKNVHFPGYSLVNLNRAGVPLAEIVSAPDLSSPEEAGAYLRALHGIVTYLGICDGNMQEGNFRCDVNVSVRPKGTKELGTRAEIKNVNSFRFVEKALEYEISRQIGIVKAGGRIEQETRTFDSAKNVTLSMRSKEEAHDYRYFPDPDLIPLVIDPQWIERVRESLPELPAQKKVRYLSEFGLSAYDAGVLTSSKTLAEFFEKTISCLVAQGKEQNAIAKNVANYLTGEVARRLNEENIEIDQSKITPEHCADVVKLVSENTISNTAAKQVLTVAWKTGDSVARIVEREGLQQVSDTGALDPLVDKIIAAFPGQVAEFKAGKEKLLGFFVGQIMKETGGKANPVMLQALVKKKLS